MRYQPLFHIVLKHQYYADMRCHDMTVVPDAAGMKVIRGHRLITAPFMNGLSVLVPTENDKPIIAIRPETVFTFHLLPESKAFYQVTDLPEIAGKLAYDNPSAGSELVVSKQTPQGPMSPDTLGCIRISNVSFKKEASTFSLTFNARKTTWKYLLITNDSPDGFTIGQGGTDSQDKEVIRFKAPRTANEKDDVTLTLPAGDYLDMKKIIVESAAPVRFLQQGRKNIQLKKDDQVLIDHLPNPRPEAGGIQVIKYIKS